MKPPTGAGGSTCVRVVVRGVSRVDVGDRAGSLLMGSRSLRIVGAGGYRSAGAGGLSVLCRTPQTLSTGGVLSGPRTLSLLNPAARGIGRDSWRLMRGFINRRFFASSGRVRVGLADGLSLTEDIIMEAS